MNPEGDTVKVLMSASKPIMFRKNEYLLQSDETCDKIYLVRKGVVRHFVFDTDQKEKTIRISKENDFFYSSIVSHFTGEPSYINCQALTDCSMVYWDKESLDELMSKHESIREFRNQQLINFIIEKHKKELSLIINDSATRLEDFNKTNISLFNRIPHHIIASYLNISPETLSRLRASSIS